MKKQKSKYSTGDIVGIVGGCMAEFEVINVDLDKKRYAVKCLKLAHPHPEQSSMKIGQIYGVPEYRIMVKLRDKKETKHSIRNNKNKI
jgi:hypothetical protein